MKLKFEQMQEIVLRNPNKKIIEFGREQSNKLLMHVYGRNLDSHIKHASHFCSPDLYAEQKKYAISNKDFFARLLQPEDMVFTAQGGSSYFYLPEKEEEAMNQALANVKYGMNLRKWSRNFALPAYRTDPMGIIFIEVEKQEVGEDGEMTEPNAYPTYKSIHSIYDYYTHGRNLEYVVFQLPAHEAIEYGVQDDKLKDMTKDQLSDYFRIVDDAVDIIVKRNEETISVVKLLNASNPITNVWGRTPGFVISDIMMFDNPKQFLSPIHVVVELADTYLQDRSVRELQKKMHGFAKAIEPILRCSTCAGGGTIDGVACKDCTPPGAKVGTGFKLKTKPSDVARFPIEVLEKGFDFTKVFGYVTPPVETWDKQDFSLNDLEELAEMSYYGTVKVKRQKAGGKSAADPITATESRSNDAPKEARLNMTADWLESTENIIAWFIGKYWFPETFKRSAITVGRDYILQTAEELMDNYLTLRTKGAPDLSLNEALARYYHARYQKNPIQLQKYLKMMRVEPFPHISINIAKTVITDFHEFNKKLYFHEWATTLQEVMWITKSDVELRSMLDQYVKAKGLKEPEAAPVV